MTDKYILLGIYENDEPRANVEVLCMSEDLHKVRRIRDKIEKIMKLMENDNERTDIPLGIEFLFNDPELEHIDLIDKDKMGQGYQGSGMVYRISIEGVYRLQEED